MRPEIKEIKLHKRKPNHFYGELAQLARASALHAEGQGFESLILHHY